MNRIEALRGLPETGKYRHAIQDGEGFHKVLKNLLCPKTQKKEYHLLRWVSRVFEEEILSPLLVFQLL